MRPARKAWHPALSVRLSFIIAGLFVCIWPLLAAALAFQQHVLIGAVVCVAFGAVLLAVCLIPAFIVSIAVDSLHVEYRSVHPWSIDRGVVRGIELRRVNVTTFGLGEVRILDAQGRVVRRASNLWSDAQLREMAAYLGVGFTLAQGHSADR